MAKSKKRSEPRDVTELRKFHHEQLLKQYYTERDKHVLGENEFYASSAGYCPRYIHYSKKYNEPHDVYLLDIFELGDAVHDYWEKKIIEKFGGEAEKELRVDLGDIVVRGRCDVLDSRNVVWELKSASELPDEPYEEHVMQLNFYIKHLNAKYGVLLYIKKNTNSIRGFKVEFDPRKYEEALEIWRYVYYSQKNGRLPIKVPSWKCRNCPYRKKCEKGEP